jgi:hypothetical protein
MVAFAGDALSAAFSIPDFHTDSHRYPAVCNPGESPRAKEHAFGTRRAVRDAFTSISLVAALDGLLESAHMASSENWRDL